MKVIANQLKNGIMHNNTKPFLFLGVILLLCSQLQAHIDEMTYKSKIVPYNDKGDATGVSTRKLTTQSDATIMEFPYIEDFDECTNAVPTGWQSSTDNEFENRKWSPNSIYGYNGTCLFTAWMNTGRSSTLLSPEFNLPAEGKSMSISFVWGDEHPRSLLKDETGLLKKQNVDGGNGASDVVFEIFADGEWQQASYLSENYIEGKEGKKYWRNETIDLTEYAGKKVQFRWINHALSNHHNGASLDEIVINVTDGTFVFTDLEGNEVPNGTVITVSELNEKGQMVVPLYVKNASGAKSAVSMYETLDAMPNGDWQTCAFGNCMILHETGYSPKNIVAANYNASIQTEWIPVEEEYATWEATLQIHVFNIVTKSSFGQLIEQPGDEVIGYGPKVTVRFEYKDPDKEIPVTNVATPVISVSNNNLRITCTTLNSKIFYTLDGSIPTKSNTQYTTPITLTQNCTVKAIAVADGYEDSEVATYTVDWFKVENVSIIFENKFVQMSTLTPDARIYYTIDGSTPTEKSIRYTEPFMVATSCTVKAIAYKDNFNPSEVTSKDIDVSVFTCAAPMFQRDGNSVSIVCSTAGASIYYTQDGSNPNTNSTPYTEPIQLVHNGTLKAIAVKENYYDSQVVTYTVNWFQVESVAIIFENKLVQISTPTPDARIYYTMDGTTPTAQSLQYTNPFEVTANCTIKAIAYKDNFNPSEVVSKYIDISVITCADPSFQRDGNSVSIVCSTAGASIYYTLDGSNPTTGSTPYTAPIQLGQNGTLKAIAVKENYYDSQVVTYSVNWFQVESVAITYENKLIQMSTPTPDARIYYTMDGTTPTAQSLQYTNPFVVTANCTIKAIAYKDNFNPSEVTSKYIDVSLFICAAPTFQREGNTVSIMSSTDGATIYYTTDGSEPTVNSTKYSTPITLTQNGMLKALAAKENYDNSQVASYTVDWFQVEKVVISNEGNRIQLSSPTPDARIYYTLDGSTPTDQSVRYTEPFTLAANCTVKAVAYKDNFNPSEVSSKDIDVSVFTCAAPMFQRDGNTVTLVSSTEGATIYYTQDGSQPRTSSTIYSAPITFTHNAIIKAITVKQNYINSDVATYYIDWFKVEEVAISNEGKRITMSTPTADAHIYYTLDGSTPTENSVRYTEPFMVPTACTIQAMAIKENFNSSNVTSKKIEAEMIICAVPSFQRDGNKVAIACLTEGAVVYYTLDGSEPTKGSNVYTNPVTLTQNGVLKAVAVKDYYDNSQTASYTVDWFKVEAVTITFLNLKVTLSTATPNARIYYTLDGSTPTENSMRYSEPFGVAANCMVNAVAFKENFNPSDLTSLYIDLENVRCDLPTFQQTDKELAIITQTEGATVYYTLDGSEPTIESNRYDGSITLTRNGTVKAIAVKDGYLNSRVATYEVTSFQVAMPSFAVDGSVLTITCGTEEAAIYYIIGEGNLEITEQNKYTGPITLTENNIVRAIGVKEGYRNSEVATYNHNSETCHDVAINYNGRYVTLSTTTDGASIYYTTDGSNPTAESQQYNGNAIVIDALCRVNAVATKQNLNNSNVASLEIAYVYDGQAVVVRNAGLLSRAFEWHQGTAESIRLIVKGTLNASDLDFIKTLATVKYLDMKDVTIEGERLPDEAFAYTNLISIELPVRLSRTGKNLFEGCNSLAAIIWNANTLLTEEAMMGFSNPNLLVYVNSLSLAPVVNNVVSMANNKAANIVLEDVETGNGTFYCPRTFKADQISYRRNFTLESGKQASGGWETIALPFNVASVTHEQHGLLAPFGSTVVGAKPFWLYSLQSTGFNPAVEMVANTPYIICMPNHADYADEYNQNGYVTFSATNAEIPVTATVTSVQETSNSSISLIPTFSHIAKTSGIYAINREVFRTYSPGSIFVDNLRDVHPFEAYSTIEMNSAGSRAPLYIPIGERMVTAIQDITSQMSDTAKVYNLNGLRVKTPGKGLYIVNGRKVIIK